MDSGAMTWALNIVQGKTYESDSEEGRKLWSAVQERITLSQRVQDAGSPSSSENDRRFGAEYLAQGRLGQGAFRVLVTDAYLRRCAVTGERTLPVLEAAHIKPYALEGPHSVKNGILLRSDLHKLFDLGYVTVTPTLKLEVSPRLKAEWENGREPKATILARTPDSNFYVTVTFFAAIPLLHHDCALWTTPTCALQHENSHLNNCRARWQEPSQPDLGEPTRNSL